jgi:hypothetical protein
MHQLRPTYNVGTTTQHDLLSYIGVMTLPKLTTNQDQNASIIVGSVCCLFGSFLRLVGSVYCLAGCEVADEELVSRRQAEPETNT